MGAPTPDGPVALDEATAMARSIEAEFRAFVDLHPQEAWRLSSALHAMAVAAACAGRDLEFPDPRPHARGRVRRPQTHI